MYRIFGDKLRDDSLEICRTQNTPPHLNSRSVAVCLSVFYGCCSSLR